MPYDVELADRVRTLFTPAAVEKAMFGGLAFLVAGNMAVAVSGQGGLMVRIDPETAEDLLEEPGAGPMEMGGRGAMKGWLLVRGPVLDDATELERWVSRGARHAASLPPKR